MKKNKKRIFAIIATLLLGVVFVTMGLVGCKEKAASDTIAVVVREDGSGTKAAFMEIIGLKGMADTEGAITASSTAAVLENVKTNKNAIGYDSLGFVTNEVKKLKIDGIEATVENITSGKYKIARPLNVLYKTSNLAGDSDKNKANKVFLDYIQSQEAQTIITNEGYVATKADAVAFKADATIGTKQTVTVSGSTSLQPLMEKLVAAFKKVQTNVDVNVTGGGSGTGAKNAENDTSVFGMISRDRKSGEAPSCDGLYEVAKDGIAVIVNVDNKIDDITLAELVSIYNPVTKWSDVKK